MFKRVIAFAVSALMALTLAIGFTVSGAPVSAAKTFDENNIVCRFPALSDIHISTDTCLASQKFAKALKQINTYGPLDAFLVGGDFTDFGRDEMVKNFTSILTRNEDLSKTRLVLAMGNHELFDRDAGNEFIVNQSLRKYLGDNYENGAPEEDFDACRYHTQVKGIEMIAISCFTYNGGVKFRQEDLDWLDRELAKTSKTSPVFITMHPMVRGMQWGSNTGDYWATTDDDLKTILQKYPQTIVFSGHLHFPLNEERSIQQDGFTAVGTGAVYFASCDDKDIDGQPYNNMQGLEFSQSMNFSQGLMVEVDKNGATRITRLDFHNNRTIKDPWIIPAPTEDGAQNTVYTTEARQNGNKAPSFPSSATATAKVSTEQNQTIDFTFTRATDDDMVLDYTVKFIDKATDAVQKTLILYNDFIRKEADDEKTITYSISDRELYPFASDYCDDYYMTVVARDSFGLKSDALKSDTIKGSGIQKEKIIYSETPHTDWKFKPWCDFDAYEDGHVVEVNNDYNSWPSPDMIEADKHPPMIKNGWNNSMGMTTELKSKAWYFDVYFTNSAREMEADITGGKEFWMWIDASDISLKNCFLGFRTENGYGPEFVSKNWKDDPEMCMYRLADGSDKWEKVMFNSDSMFDLSNFKGFIRFNGDYLFNQYSLYPEDLQGFVFGFDPADENQIGKKFVIDQIGFAGPTVDNRLTVAGLLNGGKNPDSTPSEDSQPDEEESKTETSETSQVTESTVEQTTESTADTTSQNTEDSKAPNNSDSKDNKTTTGSTTSKTSNSKTADKKEANAKTGVQSFSTLAFTIAALTLGSAIVLRKKNK